MPEGKITNKMGAYIGEIAITGDYETKQCELSRNVILPSRNAVRMPREYAIKDFRSLSKVQIFIVFFRRLYQSLGGI